MPPRYFFIIITAAITILLVWMLVSARPAKSSDASEEVQWTELEMEVPDTGFSKVFIDSLKHAYNCRPFASLRKIDSPVYMKRERFVIEVGWGMIKAGYGIVDFEPDSAKGQMNISIKGATNNFTSSFFKVRDYVCATLDAVGGYPLFFQEQIQEGKYRQNRWALFDQARLTVYCFKKDKQKTEVNEITHDYLTLLYLMRSRTLTPGDTFSLRCFVYGTDSPVLFKVGKRKEITTKAGTFNCISVEPRLIGKGKNFSENDKVYLWLTDDPDHMPVLVKSKVKVGWIEGELIYYE